MLSKIAKYRDPVGRSVGSSITRSDDAPPAAPPVAVRRRAASHGVIAEGTHVTGAVGGEDEMRVDGVVDGSIECRILVIGATGQVDGTVEADEVRIAGTFHGRIRAATVALAATAHVFGDIVVRDSLAIEMGAVFDGETRRDQAATNVTEFASAKSAGGRPVVAAS